MSSGILISQFYKSRYLRVGWIYGEFLSLKERCYECPRDLKFKLLKTVGCHVDILNPVEPRKKLYYLYSPYLYDKAGLCVYVQKIGKGKSPVLPKEKDPSFNLRDRLNDTLLSEKYGIEGYTTGSKEILDERFYNVLINNLNNSKQVQRQLFEELFNLGSKLNCFNAPCNIGVSTAPGATELTRIPWGE